MNELIPPAEPGAAPQAFSRAKPPQPSAAMPVQRRFTLRDLLVQFFYHGRLLRNCVLTGLVVGGAVASSVSTQYSADTLMMVFIGPESAAAQDSSGTAVVSVDGLKVVQSEIQIIQTDQVIRSAVQAVGPETLYPALARPRLFGLLPARDGRALLGATLEKFRTDLRVEAEAGSNLIRISFTHPDRDIAIRTVQAVLDAYLVKRREIYASTNSSFLDQQINRYRTHLAGLETEIQALRKKYDVLDMAQDVVLAANRLDGIVQRQNQVRERRVAVQTEVVAVRANLAAQPAAVMDFRETTNNTGNDEARNTLVRLQQERTHLLSQYGPTWGGLREIDQKIETVKGQMSAKGQSLYFTDRTIRNPSINVLENRLAALEVEEKALGQQLDELAEQYRQADQRIKMLREADAPLHTLQLTRDVAEGIYRQLSVRQPSAVFQDSVVDERNANLRVVQPPNAPIIGRALTLSYVLGGVFLGLLFGVAAAVVGSLTRQVYLTPGEVERDLGQPSLGEFSRPGKKSDMAERHAGVADLAGLLQDVTVGGRKLASLQVVGAPQEHGTIGVVRALGIELATGYELPTLIVDLQGDGRGLAQALAPTASAPLPPAAIPIAATRVANLWVTVGAPQSVLGDPHAPVSRLRGTMDALRQQFGMVLVIAAADASEHALRRIAALVDANVLVLQAEQTRAPVAARLCDSVLAAGGNLLGFLFTERRYYVPNWLYRWT